MNINRDEIKQYLKNFNPEHFTEEDVDVFVSEINIGNTLPDFNWETGATKCVIIPEERDYVIKIPFDGEMDYYEERQFRYFYNGGGEEGWDYCLLEQEYFIEYIEGTGFEKFFLVPETIEIEKDWPVYVQEKVLPYLESEEREYKSVKSLYTVRTSGISHQISIPEEWLAVCLENLNNDVDKLQEFITFLKDNFSDLHTGNIGYKNGQAIILDFGGFSH